jgi:Undecaprenyl-phosphate glucose phosphotransferase
LISRRYRLIASVHVGSDLLATALAFFAAWHLRFTAEILPFTSPHQPEFGRYLRLLPIVFVLWTIVFYFHGLYQVRRSRNGVDEALTLLVAVLLATILLSVVITWYRQPGEPRPDGTFEIFTYSRAFLGLFAVLDNHQELGFRVVGFLDDDPAKAGRRYSDTPVLGRLDEIDTILESQRIDQVYLALPLEAHARTLEMLQKVGAECVEVKMVPDILQFATLKAEFENLDGTPVINLSQVPLHGWSSLVKRAMDIAIAATALSALVPVFPLVALAIWLEDRGPIFYRQERMGLDGRSFWIWKLRSMRVDAEITSGPVWAIKDDPRRTRTGSFLRDWSIDELPQLWNVLGGDMSIVGPRPERPAFVREFKGKIPQYMVRHRVKSGITGWAQVHGWRGNTSIRKRIQYDLYYIENWSLGLDIKILWLTLRHGLRLNAY